MSSSDFTSGPVRNLTTKEMGVSDFSDFELLSDSGHNLVYRAMCGGKWVVLKCARVEEGNTTRNQQLLLREYDIMCAVDNLYVVRTWQMTEVPGLGLAIVMEYVHGRTLDAYLQEKPSFSERMRVAEELLEALISLHERQIVHGDLKGTNILITEVGNHVRLIDFGFADTDAYVAKNIGTTPSIQSPDQQPSPTAETADIRRDIYALGKILSALFPHRFACIRRRCLHHRYSSVNKVRTAIRRQLWWQKALPLMLLVAIGVFAAVFRLQDNIPAPVHVPPQKDTIVIVSPRKDTVVVFKPVVTAAPKSKTDTVYQQIIVPAEPVDSQWLAIKQKAEKTFEEYYCLAADSVLNMEEPEHQAAVMIHNNFCRKMYEIREQLIADYPDYEDQIMEYDIVLYGRYYTRLNRIWQDYPFNMDKF